MKDLTFSMVLVVAIWAVFLEDPLVYSDASQGTTFTSISSSAGVKIFRASFGNPTWVDFDNDGDIDVFIINHGDSPSLFRNNGDGTFTDIRPGSGISTRGDRHGAAWGDYDNDGDPDLFITLGAERGETIGSKTDQLFRNEGSGIFTDVTTVAGVTNAFGRGRSVNWIDFNNDGYLDLFVKNFETPNILYRNNGDGTFTEVTSTAGITDAHEAVSSWADYDKDGDLDLFITSGTAKTRDQLWRNNGNGRFTEVTSVAGLSGLKWGRGVAWGDYNNDGNIDLYIARGYVDIEDSLSWDASSIFFSDEESSDEDGLDFGISGDEVTFDLYFAGCRQPSKIFIGSGRASPESVPFTLKDLEATGKPLYIPGQELGFFIWKDNEGWHIRWSAESKVKYFYGKITTTSQFTDVQPLKFTRLTPTIAGTLYRNNGDRTFTDVTQGAAVGSTKNNRGAIWNDYDNDGFLDLYVVSSGSYKGNSGNTLYRNKGNGTFENVTGKAGVWANVNGRGDGAAWGDFNNDGFLDLYVTNGWGRPILAREGDPDCLVFGPHVLYKNNGNENRWIKIMLLGKTNNKDAIGAKLTLRTGGLNQYKEVNGGGGGQFFSQGGGPIHFGLGQSNIIDSLTIRWPSGITQTLTNIHSNQSITMIEENSPP